ADGLASEEGAVLRNGAAKGADERLLELALRNRADAARLDLAQLGPLLGLAVRRHRGGRLDRPREAARDHPVERDLAEGVRCGARLLAALLGQGDVARVHALEVADLRVPHEVDAASQSYRSR